MRATEAEWIQSLIVMRRAVECLNNIYDDPFAFVWEYYGDTMGDVLYVRKTHTPDVVFSDWACNIARVSPEVVRDNILNGLNPDVLSKIARRNKSCPEGNEEVGEELTNFLLGIMGEV